MLEAGDVTAMLPLLSLNVVVDGRYDGLENATGAIIKTPVVVHDLAADVNTRLRANLSLQEHRVELGRLSDEVRQLSDADYASNPPFNPFAPAADRPLSWFVSQFTMKLNRVVVPNSDIITLTCNGELIRGATAIGAASSGSARWPPTFNAHVDQNIDGEPLKGMGVGWLFKLLPRLQLLNVWMPLNDSQVRPLALLSATDVPAGSLVDRQEETFGIQSDRYFVSEAAAASKGWLFHSQMRKGEAFVFRTDSTPHTSFGRDVSAEGGEATVRYSGEMRCASLVFAKGELGRIKSTAALGGLIGGVVWLLFMWRRRGSR